MVHERLLLECPQCGKGKLIDVAVSESGLAGPAKCDACKADDLLYRTMPRTPLSRSRALGGRA